MTDTQYIQSDPDSRRANSEELAALIIRYQKSIRSFVLPNDAARMVELAELLQAPDQNEFSGLSFDREHGRREWVNGVQVFADHGDGTHVHFERVDEKVTCPRCGDKMFLSLGIYPHHKDGVHGELCRMSGINAKAP